MAGLVPEEMLAHPDRRDPSDHRVPLEMQDHLDNKEQEET